MVFCVIFLVIPLCLPNNLTSLDYAGVLGFVLVLFLTGWVTVKCIIEGFPAINNGFAIGGFGTLGVRHARCMVAPGQMSIRMASSKSAHAQ